MKLISMFFIFALAFSQSNPDEVSQVTNPPVEVVVDGTTAGIDDISKKIPEQEKQVTEEPELTPIAPVPKPTAEVVKQLPQDSVELADILKAPQHDEPEKAAPSGSATTAASKILETSNNQTAPSAVNATASPKNSDAATNQTDTVISPSPPSEVNDTAPEADKIPETKQNVITNVATTEKSTSTPAPEETTSENDKDYTEDSSNSSSPVVPPTTATSRPIARPPPFTLGSFFIGLLLGVVLVVGSFFGLRLFQRHRSAQMAGYRSYP